MNLWLKDPKTGKPSVTLSLFVYGFIIVSMKLIFSGIQMTDHFKLAEFSGLDFAAAVGALGTIYTMRKNKTIKPDDQVDKDPK